VNNASTESTTCDLPEISVSPSTDAEAATSDVQTDCVIRKYYEVSVYEVLSCFFSVVTIIVSKLKSRFKKRRSKSRYFPCGGIFFYDFNAFNEQYLNCVFSVQAIRTVHDYFDFDSYMAFEHVLQ